MDAASVLRRLAMKSGLSVGFNASAWRSSKTVDPRSCEQRLRPLLRLVVRDCALRMVLRGVCSGVPDFVLTALPRARPALGPQVIAGELKTVLQGRGCRACSKGRASLRIAAGSFTAFPCGKSRPGGGHHIEIRAGGDQGDQERRFKTLMGQGGTPVLTGLWHSRIDPLNRPAGMISSNDFRTGTTIETRWCCLARGRVPARQARQGFSLRPLQAQVSEERQRRGENLPCRRDGSPGDPGESPPFSTRTWKGKIIVFMDMASYEETRLSRLNRSVKAGNISRKAWR